MATPEFSYSSTTSVWIDAFYFFNYFSTVSSASTKGTLVSSYNSKWARPVCSRLFCKAKKTKKNMGVSTELTMIKASNRSRESDRLSKVKNYQQKPVRIVTAKYSGVSAVI